MRLTSDNPIKLLCSRCGLPVKSGHSPTVGIGQGDVRVLHAHCAALEAQFLQVNGARQITLTQLLTEIQGAMGL